MSVTDEIKSRLDIVSYIQQYVPLKKSGRYYKALCPFHSERTPSFVVNVDTQSWRCFGACADGGDIFSFAMKHHGWSFSEALQELGKQAGVEVRQQSPAERQRAEELDRLRGLLQAAADIYHKNLTEARTEDARATLTYVREKRGLTDETIAKFALGYAPPGWQNMLDELTQLGYEQSQIIEAGIVSKSDTGRVYDRFRNRLMIPIRDERGRVIGFGARALDPDDNPKYLNSPQTPLFDKSRTLFGLDAARRTIRDTETAVIAEGYLDVIQAHQAGFTNLVAQMGTAMTEMQLRALAPRYAKKIILALDADAAGQNATRRSLETARQTLEADYAGRFSVDIRILEIPGAKDPDDLIRETPEQWHSLVENALPVADYVINMEMAGLPSSATVQEREAVARRILPILTASENNLYTQDNLQKLSLRLHIPERDLLAWAEQERKQNVARRPAQNRAEIGLDEPPPIDYDSIEPPPDVDPEYETVATTSQQTRATQDNALEAYCLRMLLTYPDAYYQINRRLRELAGPDTKLQQGPLCDLGVGDFSQPTYRTLMQMFIFAVRQDELDVLDFLSENLDPVLIKELGRLLVDESDGIRQRVQKRFNGDLDDLWKQYERRTKPGLKPDEELLEKAVRLRLERLKRELDEFRFMQLDTEQPEDQTEALELELGSRINLLRRAKDRLDAMLQPRQLNPFI